MKSFSIWVAVFAFAGCAVARNCTPGLNYCGSTLLAIGNYQGQIDQAITDAGIQEVDNGRSTLFSCQGGNQGVIKYIQQCTVGKCVDGGGGKNDFCT